jgi:hypothetical protein
VYAIADEVDGGRYPEPEIGAGYCEQEPEAPNAEPTLPKTSKTASSISSFDACFCPSFINIPYTRFINCILFYCKNMVG